MKLLFVIVSLIVVYTTHSRDLPIEARDSVSQVQQVNKTYYIVENGQQKSKVPKQVQQLKETSSVVAELSGLELKEVKGLRKKKFQNGITCVGGINVGGDCLTFSDDKLKWVDAAASCAANGSRLPTPTDPQDLLDYVLENYGSVYFWVGGSDAAQEGNWTWVTGEGIDAELPWGRNEPNNGGNQDCLAVNYKHGYDDGKCKRKHRYICETATLTTTTPLTTTTTTTMPIETTTEPGCLTGGFQIGYQCFKRYSTLMTWTDAQAYCTSQGLQLAQPANPKLLHQFMTSNGWVSGRHWLGGRGTGSAMGWLNGTTISNSNSLWVSWGVNGVSSDWGLDLLDSGHTEKPLDADSISSTRAFVCEQ